MPDRVEGAGHVDVTVDRLLLLPGTYDLTVAFTDYSALHPFDYRHRVLRFDVEAGEPRESYGGVVSLGGRWSVHADAPPPEAPAGATDGPDPAAGPVTTDGPATDGPDPAAGPVTTDGPATDEPDPAANPVAAAGPALDPAP